MSEENKQEIVLKDERGHNIIETDPSKIAHNLVAMATRTDIMTPEDKQFFIANTERWSTVQQNCHIWRTQVERDSILSEYPTTHLQFHQAILENKVFIDETIRLAKDAEMQKLDAEELYIDIENLKDKIQELETQRQNHEEDSSEYKKITHEIRKKDIKLRKKTVELQEKAYQIQQSAIAMKYRMQENKGWKEREDQMIEKLLSEGYTEEQIWNKNYGQKEGYFFLFLTKYNAVSNSTDSGEVHNLTYLARFAVEQAIQDKVFKQYLRRCNTIQLQSLQQLGAVKINVDANNNIVGVDILVQLNPEDE